MDLDEIIKYLGDETHGLVQDIFLAINDHCFYLTLTKAHENNKKRELSTNNVMLANFITRGYSANQLIRIARLIDGREDVISLMRIISELKKIYTNKSILKELNKWQRKIETNPSLKKIKNDRHKLIAHLDEQHFESPVSTEIKTIENALIILAYVAKKLSYLNTQTIETFSWYPSPDTKEIFRNLDTPFFFPSEIDSLTEYFLEYQKKINENIKNFNSK